MMESIEKSPGIRSFGKLKVVDEKEMSEDSEGRRKKDKGGVWFG